MQNSKGPSKALSNSLCRQNEDQDIICPPKTSLHLLTQNETEQRPNNSILGLPFTSKLLFHNIKTMSRLLFFFCPNFILYFLFILFTADFFFFYTTRTLQKLLPPHLNFIVTSCSLHIKCSTRSKGQG